MLNGWVSLDRAILKHWVSQEPELLACWVHLLLEANFEDKKRMFNGSLVEIKRGECVFGLNAFSARTGISPKKLRRYIDMLESEGMVGRQKNNKFSLISITNYDYYQTEGSQRASQGQARKGKSDGKKDYGQENRAGKGQAESPDTSGLELFDGGYGASKGQAEGKQRASRGQHLNKGNNINKGNNKELTTELATPDAVFYVPTNKHGTQGETYPVTESDLTNWAEIYPAVDLQAEMRKIIGWSQSNPAKRKTLKGMPKFINSWLSRAQDKGGSLNTTSKSQSSDILGGTTW